MLLLFLVAPSPPTPLKYHVRYVVFTTPHVGSLNIVLRRANHEWSKECGLWLLYNRVVILFKQLCLIACCPHAFMRVRPVNASSFLSCALSSDPTEISCALCCFPLIQSECKKLIPTKALGGRLSHLVHYLSFIYVFDWWRIRSLILDSHLVHVFIVYIRVWLVKNQIIHYR